MEKTKAALKLLELASSQISPSYKDELSKKTKDIIGLNFDELANDVALLSIPSEWGCREISKFNPYSTK